MRTGPEEVYANNVQIVKNMHKNIWPKRSECDGHIQYKPVTF